MATSILSPFRRALAGALVLAAAAGCTSSPQLAAQWTDPQLGPQSAFLRGSRVLVACDVADLTVRQLCQDRLAAEVSARGVTPVFTGRTRSSPPTGRSTASFSRQRAAPTPRP
jgi:hypothetical protein